MLVDFIDHRRRLERKGGNARRDRWRLRPRFEILEPYRLLSGGPFLVTDAGDSGPDTLRQAILDANQAGGGEIDFDLPLDPSGFPLPIEPDSALPVIRGFVDIRGDTQPVAESVPYFVVLDGSFAGSSAAGLQFGAGSDFSDLRGLDIHSFGGGAILITSNHNTIAGNFIESNSGDGVSLVDSHENLVLGNAVFGNSGNGVSIAGAGAYWNTVQGNQILDNQGNGVAITGRAQLNVVGGPTFGNYNYLGLGDYNEISQNGNSGVLIDGAGTTENTVAGNFIGTDSTILSGIGDTGVADDLGNVGAGITVEYGAGFNTIGSVDDTVASEVGGPAPNYVAYNSDGIVLNDAYNNTLTRNYVGTDGTGSINGPNTGDGILIEEGAQANTVGGTTESASNVIESNAKMGVRITGDKGPFLATSGNVVEGNVIGLNDDGVDIAGSANGNTVAGNDIGTDVAGKNLGNRVGGVLLDGGVYSNVIGGTEPGAGNLIGDNLQGGIIADGASGNVIAGNFIGGDPGLFINAPNHGVGVDLEVGCSFNVIGGTESGARNVIVRNDDSGIRIAGLGAIYNTVEGNLVSGNGAHPAPDGSSDGVFISDTDFNFIGGTVPGAGNRIVSNFGDGVGLDFTEYSQIQGNVIGTSQFGTTEGNMGAGVRISDSANNTVGGTTPQARNVIANNEGNGVLITGSENLAPKGHNIVEGNYIGLTADGAFADGNLLSGVAVMGVGLNSIGGTTAGAGNVISGNNQSGIVIIGDGAGKNVIQGDLIGTDASGNQPRGNEFGGIYIGDGSAFGVPGDATSTTVGGPGSARNVISANGGNGIWINGSNSLLNVIAGNAIGTSLDGTKALGNKLNGVFLSDAAHETIGMKGFGLGNVISANGQSGIAIIGEDALDNVIQNNLIGARKPGITAMGNGFSGIYVGNAAGFGLPYIGAPYDNTIGGTTPSEGNTITGNGGNGIWINGPGPYAIGNLVEGNSIGVDFDGVAVGNALDGVRISDAGLNTIGGTAHGAGNVISGNALDGVVVIDDLSQGPLPVTTANLVQGNFIGTDATGKSALGNGIDGVFIVEANNNNVGGAIAGAANVIAFNAGTGVSVVGDHALRDAILRNSIHDNGGLGIDLGDDGETPNTPGSPHTGPNMLQSYPGITSASHTQSGYTIKGHLDFSQPSTTVRVEFFASHQPNSSGFGDGQSFLGFLNVKTDNLGNATFSFSAPLITGMGFVTATATVAGNTSEFSPAVLATSPADVTSQVSFSWGFQQVNALYADLFVSINSVVNTAIDGPFRLVVSDLGGAVHVVNATGYTTKVFIGSPYIDVLNAGKSLGPGQSVSVELIFLWPLGAHTASKFFNFHLFAGPGQL
jgi:parallel beta-helix repeat protein